MSDSFATLWTIALQAPLSTDFPGNDTGVGLLFTSPGDLPDPGIKSTSPVSVDGFFTTEPPGKP